MAQKLAAELGMGVGISSGANFMGALKVQEELGQDAVVVTMFPDDNKKYLSTGLLSEEPQKNGFLTPHIKLREVTAFKRVCYTCCDPQECMEAATTDITTDGALPHCPRRL
jgi:cysteine synthase A